MNEKTPLVEKFAIERVVTVLTPVFGALSALLARLIVTAIPSAHVSSGDLTALEITAFSWACGVALHWLHGRKQGWLAGKVGDGVVTLMGRPGRPGPAGAVGQTGETGAQGAVGVAGDVGARGTAGVAGVAGHVGDTGAQGIPGGALGGPIGPVMLTPMDQAPPPPTFFDQGASPPPAQDAAATEIQRAPNDPAPAPDFTPTA